MLCVRPHRVYAVIAEGEPEAVESGSRYGAVGPFGPPRVAGPEGRRHA